LTSTYFLNELWKSSRKGKILVVIYLCIAGGVFFYFFPVLSALPIRNIDLDRYMWLHTWR
jgi:dolichyl-phosphate-mannose--protein O-mannosyl transferase